MGIRVNTNVQSLAAQRNLSQTSRSQQQSLQRLPIQLGCRVIYEQNLRLNSAARREEQRDMRERGDDHRGARHPPALHAERVVRSAGECPAQALNPGPDRGCATPWPARTRAPVRTSASRRAAAHGARHWGCGPWRARTVARRAHAAVAGAALALPRADAAGGGCGRLGRGGGGTAGMFPCFSFSWSATRVVC